jgi:hypothetical protein
VPLLGARLVGGIGAVIVMLVVYAMLSRNNK